MGGAVNGPQGASPDEEDHRTQHGRRKPWLVGDRSNVQAHTCKVPECNTWRNFCLWEILFVFHCPSLPSDQACPMTKSPGHLRSFLDITLVHGWELRELIVPFYKQHGAKTANEMVQPPKWLKKPNMASKKGQWRRTGLRHEAENSKIGRKCHLGHFLRQKIVKKAQKKLAVKSTRKKIFAFCTLCDQSEPGV